MFGSHSNLAWLISLLKISLFLFMSQVVHCKYLLMRKNTDKIQSLSTGPDGISGVLASFIFSLFQFPVSWLCQIREFSVFYCNKKSHLFKRSIIAIITFITYRIHIDFRWTLDGRCFNLGRAEYLMSLRLENGISYMLIGFQGDTKC